MRLTQDVMDLADRFFDQLRWRGATDELIVDLAMTLARHAHQSSVVIPFPTQEERTTRQARR